jgi:hypothetical protein
LYDLFIGVISNIFHRLCCIDRQDSLVQEEDDAQVNDAPPTVSSPNLGAKHSTTDLKIRIMEYVANGESLSAIGANIGKDRRTVGRFVKRWQQEKTLAIQT